MLKKCLNKERHKHLHLIQETLQHYSRLRLVHTLYPPLCKRTWMAKFQESAKSPLPLQHSKAEHTSGAEHMCKTSYMRMLRLMLP